MKYTLLTLTSSLFVTALLAQTKSGSTIGRFAGTANLAQIQLRKPDLQMLSTSRFYNLYGKDKLKQQEQRQQLQQQEQQRALKIPANNNVDRQQEVEVKTVAPLGKAPSTLSSNQLAMDFDGSAQPLTATGAPTGSAPADVSIAAGFEHVVHMTNNFVSMYWKDGTLISSVTLDNFWNSTGLTPNSFDPKVMYDHFANRWIATVCLARRSVNSSFGVAVSASPDPTGNWFFYTVKADPNSNEWFDYPSMGFTTDKIVISGNMFFNPPGSENTESRTYVLDKNLLYNGSIQSSVSFFVESAGRTIVPSTNFQNSGTSYCIQSSIGFGLFSVYKITGSGTGPSWSYEGEIPFTSLSFDYTMPAGNQLGTTEKLDLGDSRMKSVIYRTGRLYFSHSAAENGGAYIDMGYVEVSDLSSGKKKRVRPVASGPAYANITCNGIGEVIGSYSHTQTGLYPSGGFFLWNTITNANAEFYITKYGEGFVVNKDNNGSNRWGDYNGIALDPADDVAAWLSFDYGGAGPSPTASGGYRTRIQKVTSECPVDFNVTVPLVAGQMRRFATANSMTVTSNVGNGATAKIQAGNFVVLTPGFLAAAGSNVKVMVGACDEEKRMQ